MPDDGSAGFSFVDAIPAEFSDENLTLRFTAEHGGTLRFVYGWGRWYEWDGAVWRPDETLKVFDMARRVCRTASAECDKEKVASMVASAKTVAAVERLAKPIGATLPLSTSGTPILGCSTHPAASSISARAFCADIWLTTT